MKNTKKVLLFCAGILLCALSYAQEDNERYIDPNSRRSAPPKRQETEAQRSTTPAPANHTSDQQSAMSEQITVSGVILDENRKAMAGVSVVEKGTRNVTITDFDGDYTIKAAANATLVFSFDGKETQEVSVNGRNRINVGMSNQRRSYNSNSTSGFLEHDYQGITLFTGFGITIDGGGFNLGVLYNFNPYLSLGLGMWYIADIESDGVSTFADVRVAYPKYALKPYAALGLGLYSCERYSDYNGSYYYSTYDSSTEFWFSLAAGVDWSIGQRFSIYAEAGLYPSLFEVFMFGGGVRWRFGGK